MGRRIVLTLGLLCCQFLLTAPVSAQAIQTVAGSNWVFRGNGGSASNAPLGLMYGIAADPLATDGTIYAADSSNNIVVKISRGIITVVAGNAIRDYSGDGGPAIFAALNDPEAVIKDTAGNLYIADRSNCVIRRVDANGIISTYAGNGICSFSGNNVPATQASLRFPGGLGLDSSGNLLIADTDNNCIRRVSTSGVISTIAGTCGTSGFAGDGGLATAARLNHPFSVSGDRSGNVYIADTFNHRIRKITPAGVISTLAGNGFTEFGGDGGPATSAMLDSPLSPVPDNAGSVYIADQLNQRIRKITPDGKIDTIPTGFFVDYLFGLTLDPTGQLHVSLQFTQRIMKVDPTGRLEPIPEAGSGTYKYGGDGGTATSANFYQPQYVLPEDSGSLLIADTKNFLVRRLDRNGNVTTYAGNGQNYYDSNTRGTPTSVSLSSGVTGMAKDRLGNLYLAIYGMIRQIDPIGITTIVAGTLVNGETAYVRDGVAALGAPMDPRGVAVDAAGAIYVADYTNDRVRKFTLGGNISTFAGNGLRGYSGDGGQATAARLNGPWGLAFDASGNLLIAEYSNNVIRKVTPSGIISTVAGKGTFGFSGDGGLATLASLDSPHGVSADSFGNLYIADSNNNRIRKVNASGVITTIAGTGDYAFRGDGGPATLAALANPEAVAVDSSGNLYIADADNDRVRAVFTAIPTVSVSAASLTFSAVEGAPSTTAQTVQLNSSLTGVAFTAATSAPWIVLSQLAGRMPASLSISANATQLAAGSYSGTITISTPAASPSQLTIRLTLTVAAANPPRLAVTPTALTFQAVSLDPGLVSQSLNILNTGGGTLNWTMTASTFSGGTWLTTSAASGSASASSPSIVQIRVNPATLQRGSYGGSLTISGSGQTATVAVNLIVVPGQTLLLSQTGLTFTGIEGGGDVPSQTFGVLNIGRGTMSWTAQAVSATGCGWLSATPGSGSSVANSTTVPLVEVPVNVTGLAAGQYTCQVRVTAPGADNSPRVVTVILNVLPRGSVLPAVVRPTGLIFVRPQGSSSPGSQIAKLATGAPGGLDARISSSTFDGVTWLRTAQTAARVSPGSAADIVIQPTLGTLAQGQYFGTVDLKLLDTSSGNYSSQTIEVLFVVTSPRTDFVGAQSRGNVFADCVPQQLYLKSRSLGNSISVPTGWPINLEAQVKDDCDNQISNATTIASFSTGEPAVTLVHLGGGIYQGSWRPNGNSSQVAVTVQARAGALTGKVSNTVQGGAGASSVSAISSGGIVNAAGFQGGALAPGSIVSVFGQNLATSTAAASNAPLPKSLGGMTLNIGGVNAPLYYSSSGQVNAQIPFETAAGTPQAYALVTRGNQNVFTDSETLTIIPAKPGIFTINAQGQGAVQIANTTTFAAPAGSVPGAVASPARRGVDFLTIYCTGLGAVNNPPASGSAAGSNPLSTTVTLPSVTIGGVNAPLTNGFSGLSPGFVGLYQVNVQVPAGVAPGSAVPLIVTMNGVASNTVTIAVQ